MAKQIHTVTLDGELVAKLKATGRGLSPTLNYLLGELIAKETPTSEEARVQGFMDYAKESRIVDEVKGLADELRAHHGTKTPEQLDILINAVSESNSPEKALKIAALQELKKEAEARCQTAHT